LNTITCQKGQKTDEIIKNNDDFDNLHVWIVIIFIGRYCIGRWGAVREIGRM